MLQAAFICQLYRSAFMSTPQVLRARIWGMYFTVGVIISLSLANIGHVLF